MTIKSPCAAVSGIRAINLSANPEARLKANIGSKGRPQRCARRNRIARAKQMGEAMINTRPETCAAASSAIVNRGNECGELVREIRKSSRSWEWVGPLSADIQKRGIRRVWHGPSVHLALATVRLPRGGVKIGLFYKTSKIGD